MDNNENNHINLKKEENKNDKLIDITSFCEEFSGVIGKDLFKEEQNTELIENQLRKTALEQKIIEKTKDTKIDLNQCINVVIEFCIGVKEIDYLFKTVEVKAPC